MTNEEKATLEDNEKYITILDENNEESLAEVLFTFEEKDENYVLLTLVREFDDVEDLDSEYDVLAYKYEELEDGTIGNLIEIAENDFETWQIVEEVFNTFQSTNFEME